ncbi:MAG: O-antigen ligase family protein, partial [candidate division NC10 bacterium]|nr:O-antigen ligase family protein [candidate division NC10 bacterium]
SEAPKILVIFFGSLEYLRDEGRYRRLFWVSSWVILLIGIDGFVQYWRGQDLIREVGLWRGRVRAHFASPTFFQYVLPLLPLSLALWEERISGWKKAFLAMAVMALAASSLLSRTRSVWIALALTVLFMSIFSRRRIFYLLLIGLFALGSAALPLGSGRASPLSLTGFLAEQRYQRMLAWQISYRMFLSRPLLGKGPDFFDRYQRNAALQQPYLSPQLYEKLAKGGKGVVFPIYHPHSIYLELLASQGIIGMAAFLWILATLAFSLWKGRKGPPLAFLGTSAALLCFLALGAVGTSFYQPWSYGIFWLLAGMGMSLRERDERREPG